MASIPEENFYRATILILDVIPSQLRKYFKDLWDTRYPSVPWDDTVARGELFLARERNIKDRGILNDIKNGNTNKWDGTTLSAVLLNSSHNFLKTDPNARVCIDKLRSLKRICFAHLDSGKLEDSDYLKILQDAKQSFSQMGWPISGIEAIALNTRNHQVLKNEMHRERSRSIQWDIVERELDLEENVEEVDEIVGERKINLFETLISTVNFYYPLDNKQV